LIDGVTITDGDLVVADDDGIVVVPKLKIDSLVARAVELEAREREVNARIRGGETTFHILDLAPDSVRPGL
jgi:4-hydroxy-4-methyl-2-oxoglutarate aldolase